MAFIAYLQMFLTPIKDLAEKYHLLQGAMASAERIFSLMKKDDLKISSSEPENNDPNEAGLVLKDLEFGYKPGLSVISNFNLTVPKGESVALLGPSGSGKTTIINLLLRLYEPAKGNIFFNQKNIKNISFKDLTRTIALVSQETLLVKGSVLDNIKLERHFITEKTLGKALHITGVANWARELPQGLATKIGEGARKLSQGQTQMLALARALAGDPQILIMDEAFSQVDPAHRR